MRVSRHLVKAEELEEFYMLVSAKEMLEKAVEGHYAVGQVNINNLEWTKAILLTAEECKLSLIHISALKLHVFHVAVGGMEVPGNAVTRKKCLSGHEIIQGG